MGGAAALLFATMSIGLSSTVWFGLIFSMTFGVGGGWDGAVASGVSDGFSVASGRLASAAGSATTVSSSTELCIVLVSIGSVFTSTISVLWRLTAVLTMGVAASTSGVCTALGV